MFCVNLGLYDYHTISLHTMKLYLLQYNYLQTCRAYLAEMVTYTVYILCAAIVE